jgi:glucosamine kinase
MLAEQGTVTAVIFCVDAGGTRCRGRLVSATGEVLSEGEDGPCNPATDMARAAASLTRLWTTCARDAGRDPAQVIDVTLALGGAGLAIGSVRAGLLAAAPPFHRTVAMSDGYAALIGAGGGSPCGLVIVGTGVAGHRLFVDGSSIERDGWGWIGGDRGSGAWIGQRALRRALAAEDGLVGHDELSARVMEALRAASAEPRGWLVGLGPERLAALAPLVLQAADEGVTSAQHILDGAVEHLAALVRTLDLGADDALYLAGGLAAAMRPRLAQRLGRKISTPQADARTGCHLVAIGAAPAECARIEVRG